LATKYKVTAKSITN